MTISTAYGKRLTVTVPKRGDAMRDMMMLSLDWKNVGKDLRQALKVERNERKQANTAKG